MKKTANHFLLIRFALFIFVLLWAQLGQALSDEEIRNKQRELQGKPVGERIAFWGGRDVGSETTRRISRLAEYQQCSL